MEYYEIKCDLWSYTIGVKDGIVTQSTTKNHWAIGKTLDYLKEYYALNKFTTTITQL